MKITFSLIGECPERLHGEEKHVKQVDVRGIEGWKVTTQRMVCRAADFNRDQCYRFFCDVRVHMECRVYDYKNRQFHIKIKKNYWGLRDNYLKIDWVGEVIREK